MRSCPRSTLTGVSVVQQNEIAVEDSDASSVATYGQQTLTIDLGPVGNHSEAESIAAFELLRRSAAQGEVQTIKYKRYANGNDNALQLAATIGTRLRVIIGNLNHDSQYFVIGESHEWIHGENGGRHITEYFLEPADLATSSGGLWSLGTSGYSELGQTTNLSL